MKIIAINGSPRKGWNSDRMLDFAMEGARSQGAITEKYHLFDISFSGCRSCFACKYIQGGNLARCGWKDKLTHLLEKILEADAIIVSAPVYFGEVPGAVRSFYERLLFPSQIYAADGHKGYTRDIRAGLIYTMNVEDPAMNSNLAEKHSAMFHRLLGPVMHLNVTDTYQFDDYSKYLSERFDVNEKEKNRFVNFERSRKESYEFGVRLAQACTG